MLKSPGFVRRLLEAAGPLTLTARCQQDWQGNPWQSCVRGYPLLS